MAGGFAEANAKEDTSEAQRWSKAITGGLIEGVTEGLFGALGVGGNEITDKWAADAASKVSSSAGKMLAKLGVQGTGEAIEEFLSYAGNYIVDNLWTDKIGSGDFSQEWDWSDVGEQMALAFASTMLSSGADAMVRTNAAIKATEKQLDRNLTPQEKAEVTQAWINQTLEQKKILNSILIIKERMLEISL